MKTSEALNEIAAALAKAQREMKPAVKDSINPAFRSKYADLASVWEAVREPLSSNGISVIQDVQNGEGGVSVTTVLLHTSGQWIEAGPLTVPLAKPDAHGVGSAISYAKRYALSAAVGVTSDVDDDANAAVGRPVNDKGVPMGKGAINPDDGVQEALTAPQRVKVQGVVEEAKACIENSPLDALAVLEGAKFETEEQIYAWGFFSAPQRRAMKEAKIKLGLGK